MKPTGIDSYRVLVFALFGRDAAFTEQILRSASIASTVCLKLDELTRSIAEGAGAVVLAEEALVPQAAVALIGVLTAASVVVDLPIIVSCAEAGAVREGYGAVAALGAQANVTLLERPVGVRTLLGAVNASLRARKRQYETRSILAQLSASETRFRKVQETTPHGLVIMTPIRELSGAIVDFEWIYANPAPNGWRGDLCTVSWVSASPKNSRGFDARNLERYVAAYEGAIDLQREFFYRHDGVDHAYTNIAFRLDDDLAVLFEDITDRKRAEKERADLLRREQDARGRAESASRMKDEFLATVSHELRTPLNAILGWSQMLRRGKLDEDETRRAVEAIERNAVAQAELIEDLLDVSRIISGKVRLSMARVELGQIVEAACDSVRPALDAQRLELSCVIDPLVPPIFADASRLRQVVWNLLSNSIKFSVEGGHVSSSSARWGAS